MKKLLWVAVAPIMLVGTLIFAGDVKQVDWYLRHGYTPEKMIVDVADSSSTARTKIMNVVDSTLHRFIYVPFILPTTARDSSWKFAFSVPLSCTTLTINSIKISARTLPNTNQDTCYMGFKVYDYSEGAENRFRIPAKPERICLDADSAYWVAGTLSTAIAIDSNATLGAGDIVYYYFMVETTATAMTGAAINFDVTYNK